MGFSISDIDKVCADVNRTCQTCHVARATDCIEWEDTDFGGRWWEVFCEPCLARALDNHKEAAELEKAADDAATARLGVDPRTFCDGCGYRVSGCRCEHDPLIDGPGYGRGWKKVAFTSGR